MTTLRYLALTVLVASAGMLTAAGQSQRSSGVISGGAPEIDSDLAIGYDGASLMSIQVQSNHLTYVWYSQDSVFGPSRQDLNASDRHEFKTELTSAQARLFWEWIKRHKCFEFPSAYPSRDPNSYGAAFLYRLAIQVGGRKHNIVADGTSDARNFQAAIGDLQQICSRIRDEARRAEQSRGSASSISTILSCPLLGGSVFFAPETSPEPQRLGERENSRGVLLGNDAGGIQYNRAGRQRVSGCNLSDFTNASAVRLRYFKDGRVGGETNEQPPPVVEEIKDSKGNP